MPSDKAQTGSSLFPKLPYWLGKSRQEKEGELSTARQSENTHNENLVARANKFKMLRVDDVMVPRADIVAVDLETPLGEVLEKFKSAGHSRLPIFKGDLDDIIGFAHIKDLVGIMVPNGTAGKLDFSDSGLLAKIRRRVEFVPASMYAETLLIRMQATRVHMALVVDEYGGIDGLVTLEDLVEPIVGNIEDEHDSITRSKIVRTDEGVWEAGTRASIKELEMVTGLALNTPNNDDDVDTIGGLVFTLAGKVPKRSEVISHESGIDFEVLEADSRRIRRLRMVLRPENPIPDPEHRVMNDDGRPHATDI